MKLFIAEDEPPAAERLIEAIARVAPQAQVLGRADSVAATRAWLAAHAAPDLLLLDIQLADGLSLDLFRGSAIEVPVIFTTAYDRFALDAFQALALDYLLKPVSDAALARAFGRAARLRPGFGAELERWQPAPLGASPQRLMGRKAGTQVHALPVAELACVVSVDKLAFAVMADGQRYRLDASMADLEQQLDGRRFFRVNRQMLVAAASVRRYAPVGKGRLQVLLDPALGLDAQVSQERAAAFKDWLAHAPP